MKLEDLKKKLYRGRHPEAGLDDRLDIKPGDYDYVKGQSKLDWSERPSRFSPSQIKQMKIWFAVFVVLFIAGAAFFIYSGLNSFNPSDIAIDIAGPENVTSGQEVEYIITVKNKTRLPISNIKLVFYLPEDSIAPEGQELVQIFDLSDLGPGEEDEVSLAARLMGIEGDYKKAVAKLSFQPEAVSSVYTNEQEFESKISNVPLILNIDLPEKVVAGQSFDFTVNYSNEGDAAFDDLQIRVQYPDEYNFDSALPEPTEEGRIWNLGSLMPDAEGKMAILGNVQGRDGQKKLFKVLIGVEKDDSFTTYAELSKSLEVTDSPLAISIKVNGKTDYIINTGDRLYYELEYKNTTDENLRNVIIRAKLDGSAYDVGDITLNKGSFDSATNEIVWNASNQPQLGFLEPSAGGTVSFAVPIKKLLPINTAADKNFTVTCSATIDTKEVPSSLADVQIQGAASLTTKVKTNFSYDAQAVYYDNIISNSGPVPPIVGQKTTYTIKLRLTNSSNDVDNVAVEAYLPPHAKWAGQITPSTANLSYNAQTGQLIWKIDRLPAGTGITLPVEQVAFQVSIIPGVVHVGQNMELMTRSTATGKDIFTGLDVESFDDSLDTNIRDDAQAGTGAGTVRE